MEGPIVVGLDHLLLLAVAYQKGCVLKEVKHNYHCEDGEQIFLNDQLLIDVLLNESDVLLPQEIDCHIFTQNPSAEINAPFSSNNSLLRDQCTILNTR